MLFRSHIRDGGVVTVVQLHDLVVGIDDGGNGPGTDSLRHVDIETDILASTGLEWTVDLVCAECSAVGKGQLDIYGTRIRQESGVEKRQVDERGLAGIRGCFVDGNLRNGKIRQIDVDDVQILDRACVSVRRSCDHGQLIAGVFPVRQRIQIDRNSSFPGSKLDGFGQDQKRGSACVKMNGQGFTVQVVACDGESGGG